MRRGKPSGDSITVPLVARAKKTTGSHLRSTPVLDGNSGIAQKRRVVFVMFLGHTHAALWNSRACLPQKYAEINDLLSPLRRNNARITA
jgi:hypothetical protein